MTDDRERHEVERGASPKVVALAILGVVLLVFALLNTDDVSVDFVLGTVDASLIVVIAVSAVIGAAIGALVMSQRRRG
jgi:uncharacterized integral membrane protein